MNRELRTELENYINLRYYKKSTSKSQYDGLMEAADRFEKKIIDLYGNEFDVVELFSDYDRLITLEKYIHNLNKYENGKGEKNENHKNQLRQFVLDNYKIEDISKLKEISIFPKVVEQLDKILEMV